MMKNKKRQKIVSVFGGREAEPELLEKAEALGKAIAGCGWILMCGGRMGIMEAVSKGCYEAGGTVIGILPGTDHSDSNPYLSIPIATGIGLARNEILACACNVAVAVGGKYGTLSEIGHALQYGKPVIALDSWAIDGAILAHSVEDVIQLLKRILD